MLLKGRFHKENACKNKHYLTLFCPYSHNAALEDLRSRHHHRGSGGGGRGHHFQASEKGSQVTSVKVVPSGAEVETDSTPVSSDVEAAASPRRSCQRKRKERRDSIGEGQDKKFSKSSR